MVGLLLEGSAWFPYAVQTPDNVKAPLELIVTCVVELVLPKGKEKPILLTVFYHHLLLPSSL